MVAAGIEDSLAYGFVQRCARAQASTTDYERMRQIAGRMDTVEWENLLLVSQSAGMEPLVFHHASEAGVLTCMPAEVADRLADAYRMSWIFNRRLRSELGALLAALTNQGIDVLVFKGVALAERYYGEIALRPTSDIDLLLHPEDVEDCRLMLLERGYTAVPELRKTSQWRSRVNRVLVFRHYAGFVVEVHWALANLPSYVGSLPLDQIWRRAEHAQVAGQSARYLAAADELRYLSYHYAAQHEDRRLIWLVDIAECVRRLPPTWDWERFSADTIAAGLATPVAMALGSAERLCELELPSDSLVKLRQAAAMPQEWRAWQAARTSRGGFVWLYRQIKAQDGIASQFTFVWASFIWYLLLPTWRRFSALGKIVSAWTLPRKLEPK
jgi:hypothetical protein